MGSRQSFTPPRARGPASRTPHILAPSSLANSYQATHARLSGNYFDPLCRRLQMLFQGRLDLRPGSPNKRPAGPTSESSRRCLMVRSKQSRRTRNSTKHIGNVWLRCRRTMTVHCRTNPALGRLPADLLKRVGARPSLKTKRWTKQIMMIFISPEHHQVTLEIRLEHLANLVPVHERWKSVGVSILAWDKHGE